MAVARSDSKALLFRWDFRKSGDLYYVIQQNFQGQLKSYDFNAQKWIISPKQHEKVSGNLHLSPQGDGNAHGMLLLQLEQVKTGPIERQESPDQLLPQLTAQFDMTPSGGFENYQGGSARDTYLLLRLMLTLPEMELREAHGRTFPFKLFTKGEETRRELNGRISHELVAYEEIAGRTYAKLIYTIDLDETLPPGIKSGKINWVGKSTVYYNVADNIIAQTTWNMAKKIETISEETQKPATLTEVYDINMTLDSMQSAKSVFDSLKKIQEELKKTGQ